MRFLIPNQRELQFHRILLIGILFTSCLHAADRVVLIQPHLPDRPPCYLTIHGGRTHDQLHVKPKEGRHSPSDEWILKEREDGTVSFLSNDPYYRGYSLTGDLETKLIFHGLEADSHPATVSRENLTSWERFQIEPVESDLVRLQLRKSKFAERHLTTFFHKSDELDYRAAVLRNLTPDSDPYSRFRLIDLRDFPQKTPPALEK